MKASSRPFKAKHNSGRCPICKRRISKDSMIVRLAGRAWWIETKVARYGKRYQSYKTADYAHAECLETKEHLDD